MINTLATTLYRLKHDKTTVFLVLGMLLWIGLQAANGLLLQLLGLHNTPYPWSFIEVIQYGFVLPVLIAFAVVFVPLVACVLWCFGGLQRAIAQHALVVWFAFVVLSWVGLSLFILWEGLSIPPDPRLIVSLLIQLPVGSEGFHHLLICLIGSYGLLLMTILFKFFSAKTQAEKVFGQARFSNALEIHRAGLFANEGIVIGKAHGRHLKLPGYEGVLVVAPTGSGKTTAIAVPNLLEWTGSGVFNDLKGELYRLTAEYRREVLHNQCFLWAPTDVHQQSACYNPFFYVSQNPDWRIRDLQLIAETLIPANKIGERFWYQSSRDLFLMIALYCFETKGMATLAEIHDVSKQAYFFEWFESELAEHDADFSKGLKQNAHSILGADEKTQRNILKDFHTRMSLFNDPTVSLATTKNDFDFRVLRRQKISIYIHIPDADQERLSPLLTLFWTQLIHAMTDTEPQANEPYGVLALMDEFGNMARINKLKAGISFMRSYRMRCLIIVQYLGQIVSTYGREDAKGFLNSKVKIAFALNDLEDAQFFSKALGTQTVKVSSSTTNSGHGDQPGSRSHTVNYRSRALMTPDELMQLSHKKEIIIIEAKPPVKADKCYWFKAPAYRQLLSRAQSNHRRE